MPRVRVDSTVHPIRRYCDAHGISQRQFADFVGISAPFVSQLINGREACGRQAALQIIAKTDGAIDLGELLGWKLAE